MLAGSQPYDPAAVTAASGFTSRMRARFPRISRQVSSAHDFAARFEHFARDAEAAGAASGTLAEFRPHVQRLMGDCQACHAIYNN